MKNKLFLFIFTIILFGCNICKKKNRLKMNNSTISYKYDTTNYISIYFYENDLKREIGSYNSVGIFEMLNSNIDTCIHSKTQKKFIINQTKKIGYFINESTYYNLNIDFKKTPLFNDVGMSTDTILVEKVLYVLMTEITKQKK